MQINISSSCCLLNIREPDSISRILSLPSITSLIMCGHTEDLHFPKKQKKPIKNHKYNSLKISALLTRSKLMKKQKNFILISMLALFLSASQISMAAELDKNMQTLAKNMSILKSSSDKTSLLNALAMMDKAVDDSMEVLPWNIDSDDKVAVKNYKNDLKKLKDEINVAKEKIESGNIESLRDSLEKMNSIKLDSHRKFR